MTNKFSFRWIFVLVVFANVSTLCFGQMTKQDSVEFTISVSQKDTGKPIKNLAPEDFSVFENKRKVKIVSVFEETKPLSIVVIPTLGEGKTCGRGWLLFPGFNNPKNDLRPFTSILEDNIADGDELAIITTDFINTKIRGFDSPKSLAEDFKSFAEYSERAQKTITTEKIKYTEFGAEPDGESSYTGVETNYVKRALLKSFDYLESNKSAGNRSVILLLRSIYNPTDLNAADREELTKRIANGEAIVNWFGDNSETVFMKMFKDFPFYGTLPKMSGGVKEPCSILQSKKSDELSAAVSNMLEKMRTRYRIAYEAENQTDQPRNLEVKLTKSGKRKVAGKAVLNSPDVVSISK